jgi:hypothetical protein
LAFLELRLEEQSRSGSFSGDGTAEPRSSATPTQTHTDYLLLESTYGDRPTNTTYPDKLAQILIRRPSGREAMSSSRLSR